MALIDEINHLKKINQTTNDEYFKKRKEFNIIYRQYNSKVNKITKEIKIKEKQLASEIFLDIKGTWSQQQFIPKNRYGNYYKRKDEVIIYSLDYDKQVYRELFVKKDKWITYDIDKAIIKRQNHRPYIFKIMISFPRNKGWQTNYSEEEYRNNVNNFIKKHQLTLFPKPSIIFPEDFDEKSKV